LPLDHVPYLFNGVKGAALWRKVLCNELVVVKLEFDGFGVMNGEIVHDDDRWPCLAFLFESLDERKERIDCVGASKGLSVHQAIMDA
jgi:hypothetical protein